MERQQSSEAAGTDNLDIETAVKRLRERIDEEGANTRVEKLKSAVESSKVYCIFHLSHAFLLFLSPKLLILQMCSKKFRIH